MSSPDEMIGRFDKCLKCGTLTVVPRSRPQVVETVQSGKPEKFKPVMNIKDKRANPPRTMGMLGIAIGSAGCATLWYPIPYVPSLLLGIIALAFAGLSHVASRRSWKKNAVLPFLGSALGLVTIYFAVFYGPIATADPAAPSDPGRNPSVGAPSPVDPAPVNPTGILPIGMARQWDNRSLKVLAARIDTIELTSVTGDRRSKDKFLIIVIEASNTLSRPDQYQQLTYLTLRGNPAARDRTYASLSDSNKRFYRRVDFGLDVFPKGGVSGSTRLPPGGSVRDILVFERPARAAGPYQLQLPLGNLGGTGTATWSIPQAALR
jgi:hypothetical protein